MKRKFIKKGFEFDFEELEKKLGIKGITDLDIIAYDGEGREVDEIMFRPEEYRLMITTLEITSNQTKKIIKKEQ